MRRLDHARGRKTAYEIACLREANRIGARGHRAAETCFRSGGSEYEIHQAFATACGQREHELPYNAIVALNEAAAVLHYQVLRRDRPAPPRSLLLDAGASYAGYGSDITRTFSYSDADFAALVIEMDALQRGLCAMAAPGVDWRDIHLSAVERIAALLREAGVIRCSVQESLDNGVARLFFPHGIGHLLGLDVHDMEDLGDRAGYAVGRTRSTRFGDAYLRLDRDLAEGMAVTIEPGFYQVPGILSDERLTAPLGDDLRRDVLAQYADVRGIRIEDDVLVTKRGPRVLTAHVPKSVADIERLMRR
jgi:Xaa-Pro aminopeptidase